MSDNPNKVFLRPSASNIPVHYQESIEQLGLMVLPHQNLALWTCKSGANVGPEGPQGPAGTPYLHDTIICQASPEYSPMVVDLVTPATHFRAPYPISMTQVRMSVATAPVGADLIVDIKLNGVSIFEPGSMLTIDEGMRTSVGSASPPVLAITTVPDDAEFTVFIVQVGSSVTGSGIKISVTGTKQVS